MAPHIFGRMADESFRHPRLAAIYDPRLEGVEPCGLVQGDEIPGSRAVESWVRLIEVSGPLVTFRWTFVFAADGQVLTSDSTLRFRERQEVETELVAQGYVVEDVRDAPDRPGREFVFLARRPGGS